MGPTKPPQAFLDAVQELVAHIDSKKEEGWRGKVGGIVFIMSPPDCDPNMGAVHGVLGDHHECVEDLLMSSLHSYLMCLMQAGIPPEAMIAAVAVAAATFEKVTVVAEEGPGPSNLLN